MNTKEIKAALLVKNILYLAGKVDEFMYEYVQMSIAELVARGSPPIMVHISSNGGSVESGLDIYDLFSVYPNRIDGVVVANAKSMAAVILQACTTRAALLHARIRIHHISRREITLDVMRDPKQRDEFLAVMEKNQARLYKILSERTKKTIEEIRLTCEKDEDMTAEEALAYGLVDRIMPIRQEEVVKK